MSTQPGQIAFTWTFSPASSAANERTRPSSPAFDAEYPVYPGTAIRARIEEMTTTLRRSGPGARLPDRGANAVVRAGEIRGDEVVEAVVRPVLVRPSEPAVRDEGVDRAALRRRRGKPRVDGATVADVALRRAGAERGRDLVERLDVEAQQAERRSLGGEPLRDRLPDPLAAAGDDDVLACESLHRSPSGMSLFARSSCLRVRAAGA